MKCQQSKEAIDLFDDLPSDQQKSLEVHLQSCDSCRAYYNEVKEFKTMIELAALQKPKPKDADKLLNQTMLRITHQETFLERIISSIQMLKHYWWRASLVSTSLVMLIVFYVEFSRSADYLNSPGIQQAGTKELVKLNGSVLKSNFKQRLERASMAAPCYSIAKRQIDKDCIKEKYGFNDI